jgi:protoheme IX farnesyltransferase
MVATFPWRDYLELCKPRVVALMLVTAVVGMLLAAPPGTLPWHSLVFGTTGIAFAAGAAAVINHLVDRRIDTLMRRTERRPVATGRVRPLSALVFAAVLMTMAMVILVRYVNSVTAIWSLASLLGYAIVYTLFLKRATPQNIVIGGAAGAAPPMLGWAAVTGSIDPYSLLLVLIIFVWTPPHFWALAIYRLQDYKAAHIPMLPVTHGIRFTKLCILMYTVLLLAVTTLPFATGMSGWLYLVVSLGLGLRFLQWSLRLWKSESPVIAQRTFRFSIIYLLWLFVAILADHYLI